MLPVRVFTLLPELDRGGSKRLCNPILSKPPSVFILLELLSPVLEIPIVLLVVDPFGIRLEPGIRLKF